MAIILASNSLADSSFEVTNSLQFDSGDSAHLTFTPSSTTNQKTYTLSVWVNTFSNSANKTIFNANTWPSEPRTTLASEGVLQKRVNFRIASTSYGGVAGNLNHSQWYHIVLAIDTTQGTAADRLKYYVDGTLVSSWSVYDAPLAINLDTGVNSTVEHQIGETAGLARYWNGLMAEINFVDGLQLAPTAFAESNGGTWGAIEYTGSYGTNGWHLDFKDSSDIGNDVSGNGNDWSPQNLASGDVKTDVPPTSSLTSYDVDFLVIAGGGGSGHNSGGFPAGAGGAGGYRNSFNSETSGGGGSSESSLNLDVATTYTITVGAGGAGSESGDGAQGTNSSLSGTGITTITSTGGGYGGYGGFPSGNGSPGGVGGSGGSGGTSAGSSPGSNQASVAGTSNQGFASGSSNAWSSDAALNSGGGGGAGAVGANGVSNAGAGGAGVASSITGSSVTRGGGGGGGSYNQSAGAGGSGGGGAGKVQVGDGSHGVAGTANTGGGAGSPSATGGSGVVILRMATSRYSGTTTGSPTVSTSGSDTILTFTGSGSYTA